MKKIQKQIYLKMILPVILMLLGFAVIIVMGATQPDEGGHPVYLNILGIAGFIIPMLLSLFLLIRLFGKSVAVSMLLKELKLLKKSKYYYFGSIQANTPQEYLDTIERDLLNSKFKEHTAEVNLGYPDYKFFLRKHFRALDSTNIHVHLGFLSTDASKIKGFFNDIADKEIHLNYGKFKGTYCAIVAVCAIESFEEDEDFLTFFNEVVFVRDIAIVKVIIDVRQNRIFISDNHSISANRGKRIIKKFILRTKSLKNYPACINTSEENIKELEEKLDNMELNDLLKPYQLSDKEKSFADTLRDREVAFLKSGTDEEGAIIFYKEENKMLYMFCDYDAIDKTFDIYGIDNIKWSFPKKRGIPKKKSQEIKEKIIQHLEENNIPYSIAEIFFSKNNQILMTTKNKK